jgi:hypothetical protein
MRRRIVVLLVAVFGLALAAQPASADPAGPTHYRSTVTGISSEGGVPADVEVDVLGGDAFLWVRAAPGTVVEVPGYEGEPYLRIDADGVVEVNERSPARWLNDSRYGALDLDVPAAADAAAPPVWTQVADGGEYAWHDHRIHFMSPALPPSVDPDAGTPQLVWDWRFPLLVDGDEVVVSGELVWLPGPSPAVPWLLVTVLAAAAVGVALRWPGRLRIVLAVAAVAALVMGLLDNVGLPPGVDGDLTRAVLPAVALVLLVLAGLQRDGPRARLLIAAAGVPLLVWGVLQAGALQRPIVPGPLPIVLVRIVVALSLAAGIGALVGSAPTRRSAQEAPPSADRPG